MAQIQVVLLKVSRHANLTAKRRPKLGSSEHHCLAIYPDPGRIEFGHIIMDGASNDETLSV
jgi:hypothetical protein